MKQLLVFFAISIQLSSLAQGFQLTIQPIYHGSPLLLTDDKEEEGINLFKCYLSSFELYKAGKLVWKEVSSYHLIDAAVTSSTKLTLDIPPGLDFDQLSLTLGVDSLASVSGAMGGDLDPSKGMYWSWNSGYIHFKLEGNHKGSMTKALGYEFHIGGYLPPFQTAQKIFLKCTSDSPKIIQMDLDAFLGSLDLQTQHHAMSTGKVAHEISGKAGKVFSCQDVE